MPYTSQRTQCATSNSESEPARHSQLLANTASPLRCWSRLPDPRLACHAVCTVQGKAACVGVDTNGTYCYLKSRCDGNPGSGGQGYRRRGVAPPPGPAPPGKCSHLCSHLFVSVRGLPDACPLRPSLPVETIPAPAPVSVRVRMSGSWKARAV